MCVGIVLKGRSVELWRQLSRGVAVAQVGTGPSGLEIIGGRNQALTLCHMAWASSLNSLNPRNNLMRGHHDFPQGQMRKLGSRKAKSLVHLYLVQSG